VPEIDDLVLRIRGLVRAHERLRQRGMSDEVLAEHSAEIEVAAGHRALQACQYAHQMGKHAGHNAVSDVLRLALVEFSPDPYVTCVDLGDAGAVYTEGFDREVRATGDEAKAIKRKINRQLIYPTIDDADEILRRADYLTGRRPVSQAAPLPRLTRAT